MSGVQGYDAVVVGSGPGGYVAALRLAQLGKRTALVERDRLGGECTNYACIPSKALLHVAKIMDYAERAAKYGLRMRVESIDVDALRKWRDGVVNSLSGGIKYLCDNYGVEVLQGEARLRGRGEIEVRSGSDSKQLRAGSVILATGSIPVQLRGVEQDGDLVVGSREAMQLRRVPSRLLIIGGGVVGLEAATLYSRLGSEVTIVEMMPQLLPGADQEVARYIERTLKQRGVKIMTNSKLDKLEKRSGAAVATVATQGGGMTVEADEVLVAVGRKPSSEGLALIGLEMDERGHVRVDAGMRTNVPGVYAVGDLVGPPYLAHKAMKQGKVAAENVAGLRSEFDSLVPSVIYSDPEIAFIGLTEEEARARGQVVVGRFPLSASGRARTMDEAEGFVKVIADAADGRILGIHMVGYGVSELAAEATMSMEFMATLEDVEAVIHPHPTLSEALMEAAEAARKRSVHIFQK